MERSPRNPNTRLGRIILLKVRRVNPHRAELESARLTAHHLLASASAAGGGSGRGATLFGGTSMRRNLWMTAVALSALALGSQASADVAPGTTITAANKSAAAGIIPDELLPFVVENFADLDMKIVETGKYTPNAAYVKATVDYACQAKLDGDGRLSNYTAGQPFPYSDWAKDATGHKCDLTPDDPAVRAEARLERELPLAGRLGPEPPALGLQQHAQQRQGSLAHRPGRVPPDLLQPPRRPPPRDLGAREGHQRRVGGVLRREDPVRSARHHVPALPLHRAGQGRRHLGVHPGAAPRATHRGHPEVGLAARHRVHARGLLHLRRATSGITPGSSRASRSRRA